MNNQIHKRLSNDQTKAILEKYCAKEIDVEKARDLLNLKRRQFFEWVKRYKGNPSQFSIGYRRNGIPRKITSRHVFCDICAGIREDESFHPFLQ